MSDRLFDMDDVPEVPLFREPPPGRGALIMDERIDHDYPPEWRRCQTCQGVGRAGAEVADGTMFDSRSMVAIRGPHGELGARLLGPPEWTCPDCLGMGSVKAMVRLLAGHRCERCRHPYVPKGDAKMLGIEPTPHVWSPCDAECRHAGPVRIDGKEKLVGPFGTIPSLFELGAENVEAFWRILTVHHLDGDKANLAWWNLAALCQRCHLQIQAKVVMERVYPHEHSEWFKPHAAGYYAHVYLCRICGESMQASWPPRPPRNPDAHVPHVCEPGLELTREQALERMDELLALERAA